MEYGVWSMFSGVGVSTYSVGMLWKRVIIIITEDVGVLCLRNKG